MNREQVRDALGIRWKIVNEIIRLLYYPVVRLGAAWAGVRWGRGWWIYGPPIWLIHPRSRVTIGDRLNLRSLPRTNPLGPNRPCVICTWTADARLTIGSDFGMTGGSVVCAESITIGDRVWMGANSIIADTDFHPLNAAARRADPTQGQTAPIVIEDDVFIGMQAIILKGVRLGRGCVIGAGSIVTRDVPPGMIAAGNPARVIGPVKPADG